MLAFVILFQIRVLLQEKTNQDKQLYQREEEITKLEGRLNNAQTDRSSLIAKVASLEKTIKDVSKGNDLLKTKVVILFHSPKMLRGSWVFFSVSTIFSYFIQIAAAENSGKKNEALQSDLSNVKHQIEVKDKEIHRLRQELDALMKTQLSEFAMFESIIVTLEKKAADLGKKLQNSKRRHVGCIRLKNVVMTQNFFIPHCYCFKKLSLQISRAKLFKL